MKRPSSFEQTISTPISYAISFIRKSIKNKPQKLLRIETQSPSQRLQNSLHSSCRPCTGAGAGVSFLGTFDFGRTDLLKHYLSLDPFVHWTREERPLDWSRHFGRTSELEVEIGFGLGDFLVRRGRERPDKDLIGIETTWTLVRRALRKVALAELSNVKVLQADARVALERVFRERSISRVYSLFPCPWPKRRHVKHRLFSERFMQILNSRLADGGEILLVTDHRPYLEWILSQLAGTGLGARLCTVPPKFKTKYERKWQGLGQHRFYEARLTKERHLPIPVKEDLPLRIHYVDHFDPRAFSPRSYRGETTVEFKEVLYDRERRKAMVRWAAAEGNLFQDFWIEITEEEKGWRIRPAKGCGMVPTSGAQRALDLTRAAVENGADARRGGEG